MMTAKFIAWSALLCAVSANIVANSLIKSAVIRVPSEVGAKYIVALLTQPRFLVGVALTGLVLGFYTVAIRTIPVSVAYMAITSLAIVGLTIVDKTIFDVALSSTKIFGIILIISGVSLVSRTA